MYNNNFDTQYFAQKRMDEYYQDCRELQKHIAKAKAVEDIRLKGAVNRSLLRQLEEERKKSVFEELIVTSDGEIQVVTRNLSIDAKPRFITNMQNPSLIIPKILDDMEEKIFLLQCSIKNLQKQIFLNPQKTGKASYLLRSFASAGIFFKVPSKNAQDFVIQLLSFLQSSQPEERVLPDEEGYVDLPDIGLAYIGEEDLTWKKAVKLCQ